MDVIVTVPLTFGLSTWINEGDPAGTPWSGEEWDFYLFGGKLRGYAPLVRIGRGRNGPQSYSLVRHGGAVACTIDRHIRGFRGWRYRDWDYGEERPFPEWQIP